MSPRRLAAFGLVVMLVAVTAPVGGSETVTRGYAGAAGYNLPADLHLAVALFPTSDRAIGGVELRVGAPYRNLVATPTDVVYGAGAALSACMFNPDGDRVCDGDDAHSDVSCGLVRIQASPWARDRATVWVLALHVGDGLGVCGGTQGVVTGTFS